MKNRILFSFSAAIALSMASAQADQGVEKCSIVKDGKGLIKESKGDCKTMAHSCAGQNPAGEIDAFIIVPAGECVKINKGDFSGVKPKVMEKIEVKS
ncbi:MAG: DUF2282 domain-containing protein [Proteobacteria bacterium]|nr:DUF2282 domain-containing protein [Pseudomonadota bacterium]